MQEFMIYNNLKKKKFLPWEGYKYVEKLQTTQLWHHQFILSVNVHKSSSRDDGEKEVIWKSEWGS